jgi:hypothetical protein
MPTRSFTTVWIWKRETVNLRFVKMQPRYPQVEMTEEALHEPVLYPLLCGEERANSKIKRRVDFLIRNIKR